jgi:putative transposase
MIFWGHDHAPDRHDDLPLQRQRFPAGTIAHAVWLYFQFSLSLRHLEDLLAARGVSLQSLSELAAKFGPERARVLRSI